MNTLLRIIAIAVATAVAVWLVPGISMTSDTTEAKVITLLLVAVLIALVNAIVKPFATALGFCLIVLTLGLFYLVINALMLMLASWLAGQFGIGFQVDGFWPALWGSIVISIVSALTGGLLGVDKKD